MANNDTTQVHLPTDDVAKGGAIDGATASWARKITRNPLTSLIIGSLCVGTCSWAGMSYLGLQVSMATQPVIDAAQDHKIDHNEDTIKELKEELADHVKQIQADVALVRTTQVELLVAVAEVRAAVEGLGNK